MQYDDFATADPAGAPLDGALFFGAEPVFWFAVLAVIVAVAVIAWMMGRSGSSSHGDAAESIWLDIDDAAKNAMKADGDALPGKASALRKTIEARLGRTLALSGGLSTRVKALDKALKGEPAEAAHKPHARPAHGPADKTAHEPAHDEHGAAPAHVTIVNPATVIVNGEADKGGHDDHGHGHGHGHGHDDRPLSVDERNDALRLAVARFNDHWRHRGERVREMRAACAELSGGGSGGGRPGLSSGH